jgi:hypothetical protein
VTKQQSIKLLDDVLNAMMAALVEEGLTGPSVHI